MAKLEFYFDPISEPCRSVQMFLDANNIPYEAKFVSLVKGEHKTEEYKGINPTQTVPAIRHGDLKLFESVAILQYLADKYSTPDHWYPSDMQKRARINEYLHWHHMNTRWRGGLLVMMKFVFLPQFFKVEVSAEDRKAAIDTLKETMDAFEKCFLKDNKFIGGDEISFADLMAIGELLAVDVIGIYVGKGRPKVEAWHKRCKDALGSHYDAAHKLLYQHSDALKAAIQGPIEY